MFLRYSLLPTILIWDISRKLFMNISRRYIGIIFPIHVGYFPIILWILRTLWVREFKWEEDRHCVGSVHTRSFSVPYFPAFTLNTESECGKMRILRIRVLFTQWELNLCRMFSISTFNNSICFIIPNRVKLKRAVIFIKYTPSVVPLIFPPKTLV